MNHHQSIQDLLNNKNANDLMNMMKRIVSDEHLSLNDKTYALNQYAILIRSSEIVHQIALEKFTRMLCIHIFQTCELSELYKIQTQLHKYFPYYFGTKDNHHWLSDYIKTNDIPAVLNTLFKRTSYQVLISLLANKCIDLYDIKRDEIQLFIETLSSDPLYNTHDSTSLHVLNTVSGYTGFVMNKIPLLSSIRPPITMTVNTNRQNTLLNYAHLISTINNPTPKHIELLVFLYMGGGITMQDDIADSIGNLVIGNAQQDEILVSILNCISPEPLGLRWHGTNNPPDILSKLPVLANEYLLRSALKHCNPDELSTFNNIVSFCKAKTKETLTFSMEFSSTTSLATEWFAYLLCMGKFQPHIDIEIKIECDSPTHRQIMLLLTLMQSKRLTISTKSAFDLAPAAYSPPQCRFEITYQVASITSDMILRAFSRGILSLHIQFMNLPSDKIATLLNDPTPFPDKQLGSVIYYSFQFTHLLNTKISVDIELSRFRVSLPINRQLSTIEHSFLRNILLETFSKHWMKSLEYIFPPNNNAIATRPLSIPAVNSKTYKARPIAIPIEALDDNDVRSLIENHSYLQLIVYKEYHNGKQYLFDIEIRPNRDGLSVIKPGPFILSLEEKTLASQYFPDLQKSQASQHLTMFSRNSSNETLTMNSSPSALMKKFST